MYVRHADQGGIRTPGKCNDLKALLLGPGHIVEHDVRLAALGYRQHQGGLQVAYHPFPLLPEDDFSLCRCIITPEILKEELKRAEGKISAVYITSPDYLGGMSDIKSLSETAREYGVPLIVDNAHGAYLRFLKDSLHPIDLGADMCCDSAHKTLPVLTGGAYLHISENAPETYKNLGKKAMELFGSTSPSYLILQSLDKANESSHNGRFAKHTSVVRHFICKNLRL